MKTSKRVLSLLCAVVVAFAMMTASTFACYTPCKPTPCEPTPTEPTVDTAVEVNKTFDQEKNVISLEAYATGDAVQTSQTDTVLVLDTSGSMADCVVKEAGKCDYQALTKICYTYEKGTKCGTPTYYYKWNGVYYKVYFEKCKTSKCCCTSYNYKMYIVKGCTKYYFKNSGDPVKSVYTVSSACKTIWTGVLYKYVKTADVTVKKLDLMKDAVNNFIDTVAKQSDATGVNHRIALVEFADGAEKLIGFTEVNTTDKACNVTKLKGIVNCLRAGGATYSDCGMEKAYNLIKDDKASAVKSAIMFTDGQPTHGNTGADFSRDSEAIGVASKTISWAKKIKDISGIVWTLDVLDCETVSMKTYMEYTSSNYPAATSYYCGGAKKADGYHITIKDAAKLKSVFEEIAQSTLDSAQFSAYGEGTVIQDKLSKYYTVNGEVKVYYVTEKNDGSKTFNNDKTLLTTAEAPNLKVTVDDSKQLIKVTGIDLGKYYVAGVQHKDGNYGRKFIVEIPVTEDGTALGVVNTNVKEESFVEDEKNKKNYFPEPTAYYPYFVVKYSEHEDATKKLRVDKNPDYDVTTDIPAGYAYAGILNEKNEYITDECGKELNPAVPTDPSKQTNDPVATYIVKEVSDIYYDTTIRAIGNNSNINNVYAITYTDSTNFKETGMAAYKVSSYSVTDSKTKAGTFVYDQGSKVSNVITSGEMAVSATEPPVQHFQNRVRTVYNVIKWTREGGFNYKYDFQASKGTSLNAYLEAYEWDFDASEDPGSLSTTTLTNGLYYFKAYAVTPDGVKVTGKTDYVIEFDSSKGADEGTYGRIKNVAEKCATEIAK